MDPWDLAGAGAESFIIAFVLSYNPLSMKITLKKSGFMWFIVEFDGAIYMFVFDVVL